MPTKRDILSQLARDELLQAADRFELAVVDRRVRDGLIDTVASSKKATLAEVLPVLSRDRLKEVCRALGLDDAGKEKAVLIERLVGSKTSGEPRPSGSPASRTNGAARVTAEQIELNLGEKLTTEKLERYLWSAADILRGSIDSSDYKGFIFGLLFLKRLSDRFDEECEALRSQPHADPDDPDEHDFFVPKRARWPEVQRLATGVGEALNKACAELEQKNDTLEGVLAGIDFNDERKLGDAKNRDSVLSRLVQHFSRLDLRNANLSEPDMLGRAYEYLIEKFADDAGKKGGEFYTPRMVVRLIVEILQPAPGMRICDPTCGSGGMLIECAHYLERRGQNPRDLSLKGQEKNLGTWAICRMNTLLHGLPDADIRKGDTIRDPKLVEGGELMLFDRVIANPPFSLDEWGREVAEHDPFGRFRFGAPPKTKGDLAFVQHMIATTNRTGMVGVVMPHGVLFRGAAEGEIRKGMLQEDLVEAVVGLPTNLFYGTGIPAAILVMNRSKKADRKRKVLFIEGSREFKEGSAQNYLREDDVKKIAFAFHAFADVDKYARVVGLDEIEKNDWNLNISRYVETADAAEKVDVAHAIVKLRELERNRAQAEAKMNGHLKELGVLVTVLATRSEWVEVTFGDLVAQFIDFRGRTPKKLGMDWGGGDIPALSANNVTMGRVDLGKECHLGSDDLYRRWMTSGDAEKGDVLLTMEAPLGNVAQVPDDRKYILSQRVVLIKPKRGRVMADFLKQYMLSEGFQTLLRQHATGTTAKGIQRARLVTLRTRVPPLGEQKKIAAILSSVDQAIEATQAVIDQLQVVKKAMMAELLTRGLPGRHTRFKQTEIGDVPEPWDVVTLGEITKESAFGPRFPATQYSDAGNVGTVRTTDLTDAWEIDYTTIPRAALDPSVVRPHLLEDGDLLVSRSGTCGVACIFRRQPIDMLPAAFLIRFRLHPRVNEEFVRIAMMVPAAQNRVQAMAAGGVQKNLSGTNLATLQLPRPPLDEQAGIVAAVSVLDVRLRAEAAVCHQLRTAKTALMSVLLTGEVRVKPD